jgi:hypothetical protein
MIGFSCSVTGAVFSLNRLTVESYRNSFAHRKKIQPGRRDW